jgi:hypothetical protein
MSGRSRRPVTLRHLFLAVLAMTAVAVALNPLGAIATHEPADKVAAGGSDLRVINEQQPILQERLKVSTPADLMIHVTSECSILTNLFTSGSTTGGSTETDQAFGQIKLFLTIDGTRVPVAVDDTAATPPEEFDPDGQDFGEVVFCNRAYQRTVSDRENPLDGHDSEDDFIRTRTANAFNWMALNVGEEEAGSSPFEGYDSPANGNNIVDVQLHADFDRTTRCTGTQNDNTGATGQTCSEALIGSRTLIIEPTHASVHEQVTPGPGAGN